MRSIFFNLRTQITLCAAFLALQPSSRTHLRTTLFVILLTVSLTRLGPTRSGDFSDLSVTVPPFRFRSSADAPNPNGTVSVLNRERVGSVDGPEDIIHGWAEV
jgi:hypothetical protein